MRRGSIIGPLILIGIGVLFLLRNVWPEIPVLDYLSRYWPFLLIVWGVIRLVEILVWAMQSKPLPREGISGGEWLLVLLICLLGASAYAVHHHGDWFPRFRGWRGVALNFGESYDYPLAPAERPCPKNCRVLIESFRGDARIMGSGDGMVSVTGRESLRSFERTDADRASKQMPLELVEDGDQIVIRTNQDRAAGRMQVSSDLNIKVPSNSSVEVRGRSGDFDIEDVSGPVRIASERPGVVELKNIAQGVHYQDPRFTLQVGGVPGDARIAAGEFTANNIIGPAVLNARSQDVRILGFTQALQLTLQRGDIVLTPGKAVPNMEVRTHSGNIDLMLPAGAKFDLKASTDRGEVHNEYGAPLTVNPSRRGGEIVGNVAGGPPVRLSTDRGTINVALQSSGLPSSLDEHLQVERQ